MRKQGARNLPDSDPATGTPGCLLYPHLFPCCEKAASWGLLLAWAKVSFVAAAVCLLVRSGLMRPVCESVSTAVMPTVSLALAGLSGQGSPSHQDLCTDGRHPAQPAPWCAAEGGKLSVAPLGLAKLQTSSLGAFWEHWSLMLGCTCQASGERAMGQSVWTHSFRPGLGWAWLVPGASSPGWHHSLSPSAMI